MSDGDRLVDLSWADPTSTEVREAIDYMTAKGLTVWSSLVAISGTGGHFGHWCCSPSQVGAARWCELATPPTGRRPTREELARWRTRDALSARAEAEQEAER